MLLVEELTINAARSTLLKLTLGDCWRILGRSRAKEPGDEAAFLGLRSRGRSLSWSRDRRAGVSRGRGGRGHSRLGWGERGRRRRRRRRGLRLHSLGGNGRLLGATGAGAAGGASALRNDGRRRAWGGALSVSRAGRAVAFTTRVFHFQETESYNRHILHHKSQTPLTAVQKPKNRQLWMFSV